jgi:hypothetical protein
MHLNFVPRFSYRVLLVVTCGLLLRSANAADYYIAPSGSSSGTGTLSRPWDIKTGLQKTTVVKGGDTLWLRGGTYGTGGSLTYTSTVKGSGPTSPVIIRQYKGERARVNAGLKVAGSYSWFWGFEVTNTSTDRTVSDINTERPRGVLISTSAVEVKLINMIIHDVGRAGVGGGTNGFEVYGTLLWGNGIYDGTGPRGDAAYLNLWKSTPSSTAVNQLRDNIAFRNFYAGLKIYTEWSDVYVEGYDLQGNVSFDNGTRGTGTRSQANFLVRSELAGKPIKRLKVLNNFSYRTPDSTNPYSAEFGCKPGSGIQCEDVTISGNVFVSGTTSLGVMRVQNWKNLQVSGNTAVGNSTLATWMRDFSPTSKTWDSNRYFDGASSPFRLSNSAYAFSSWQSAASADSHGSYSSNAPTGSSVFVRKNLYEPGERAHIIVYNWSLSSSVPVNLSSAGLSEGATYEIIDAQNYFGGPIATGVFSSTSPNVNIPINLTQVSPLVGTASHLTNKHTAPRFGVFVLRRTGGTAVVDSTPPNTAISSTASGPVGEDTLTVEATATDDQGIERVEFYIDGASEPFATDTSAPYTGTVQTPLKKGSHSLQTKAYDSVGNVAVSEVVTVRH